MTLVAKPKPHGPTHKKRTGQHHRRNHNYVKTYWPYIPMLMTIGVGLVLNSAWPTSHKVLGYATDMSIQNLLDDTNTQRTSNGEANLNLNALLDQAAQNKANDMAARNYWSHDTPDGQTPWSFITATGYTYTAAGENLAYGFTTAAYTLDGWMNSPEHRANILNAAYKEVGFGIANSPNYQNSGPETIVVAMYATPAGPVVAAATPTPAHPAPATSTPSVTHTTTVPTTATNSPSPTTSTPTPAPVKQASPTPAKTQPTVALAPEPASRSVSRFQLLSAHEASWSVFALSLVSAVAIVLFVLRHGLYWRRVLVKGERFVMHHPLLDIAIVVVATTSVLLTRSAGVIR